MGIQQYSLQPKRRRYSRHGEISAPTSAGSRFTIGFDKVYERSTPTKRWVLKWYSGSDAWLSGGGSTEEESDGESDEIWDHSSDDVDHFSLDLLPFGVDSELESESSLDDVDVSYVGDDKDESRGEDDMD